MTRLLLLLVYFSIPFSEAKLTSYQDTMGHVYLSGDDCSELETEISAYRSWAQKRNRDLPQDNFYCDPSDISVNVTEFLSPLLQNRYGISPICHGPNCWNLALQDTGMKQNLLYSSDQEFSYLLENFCTLRKTGPYPGDIGAIREKSNTTPSGYSEKHGFIYIGKTSVSKHGYKNTKPYQIYSTNDVLDYYNVDSRYKCRSVHGNPKNCEIFVNYYDCNKDIRSLIQASDPLKNLDKKISVAAFHSPTLRSLQSIIEEHKQAQNQASPLVQLILNSYEEQIKYFHTYLMAEEMRRIRLPQFASDDQADLAQSLKILRHPKTFQTLFHEAVDKTHLPKLRSFLATGENPEVFDKYGQTPLHLAIRQNREDLVEAILGAIPQSHPLLRTHFDLGQLPFEFALSMKAPKIALLLLPRTSRSELLADRNPERGNAISQLISTFLNTPDSNKADYIPLLEKMNDLFKDLEFHDFGVTSSLLLQFGIELDHRKLIDLALEFTLGAQLNHGSNNPIYLAGKRGHLETAKYLVEKGADLVRGLLVAIEKKDSATLLSLYSDQVKSYPIETQRKLIRAILSFFGPTEIQGLINRGLDLMATPLALHTTLVTMQNSPLIEDVLDGLLKGKVNLDSVLDSTGNTPLSWAIRQKNSSLVRFFVDHGVDPNQTIEGSTPLQIAQETGNTQIYTQLKLLGAQ